MRVRVAVQCSKLPSGVEDKDIEQLPVYSATSFATYLQSDFCIWMDRLAAECPDHPLCAKMRDPLGLEYFRKLGLDVEEALMVWIRCQHPEWTFLDLHVSAEDAWKYGGDWRWAAAQQTLKALKSEVDVIYQAPLYHRDLQLYGIADFILRRGVNGTVEYTIWDTKLSSHAQGHYLAQLACYAEALSSMCSELHSSQPRVVAKVGLVLGAEAARKGTAVELPVPALRPHFLRAWRAFSAFQRRFDARGPPSPLSAVGGGRWAEAAWQLLRDEDDLIIVAGIHKTQRRKLQNLGITKLQQLAAVSPSRLPSLAKSAGLKLATLQRLRLQARLQHKSKSSTIPASKLLANAKQILQHLPHDNEGDLFLDLESSPSPGCNLNYLIGICCRDGQYLTWWAHTVEDEQKNFEAVLDYIFQRRSLYDGMHVYCYGHFEAAAFRHTAERSSAEYKAKTEEFVNDVLVDLLPVVKGSLALGLPGYGLKQVERMYKKARSTDIAIALDSMVVYQKWAEESDGDADTSQLLRHIREYNEDDCKSTMELLRWLRKRCAKVQVPYVPKTPAKRGKAPSKKSETADVSKALEDFKKFVNERCEEEERFRCEMQTQPP